MCTPGAAKIGRVCVTSDVSPCKTVPGTVEWEINLSGQFGIMKVENIVPYIYSFIPVIRILIFNIGFSE